MSDTLELVKHYPSGDVEVIGEHPAFVTISDELLAQLHTDADQVVTIGDINPARYRIGQASERHPHCTILHLVVA